MIRQVLSPLIRAASTKSRLRSDSDCARSTRAPQAQPVNAMTAPTSTVVAARPSGRGSADRDQQRQRRDHQEDVGQHGQDLVDPAADVAGGDADDDGQHGRDRAGQERHEDRRPGADQQLREDVLRRCWSGRASGGRSGCCGNVPTTARCDLVGSYGAIHRPDDREEHEDAEQRRARPSSSATGAAARAVVAGGAPTGGRARHRPRCVREVDDRRSPSAQASCRVRGSRNT